MTTSEVWKKFKECNDHLKGFIEILEKHWGGISQYNLEELNSVRSANDGYSGFVYYSDTCKLFHENKEIIVGYLKENYDYMDYDSVIAMVSDFNSIKDDYDEDEIAITLYSQREDDEVEGVADCLAKFVLEEVAFAFQDFVSEEGINVSECEDE